MLELVLRLRGGLKLSVKTLGGKIIPIDISLDSSVAELKSMIQNKEGIPPNSQRLIVVKEKIPKILEDESYLSDYPISNDCTVYIMSCRLRGG